MPLPTEKSRIPHMSNSNWSEEQPPAWQGPNAPSYQPENQSPTGGWKEQKLRVLLGLTWGLFSQNAKLFLTTNFAVVAIGAIFTLGLLKVFPIQLSEISQAALNGDMKPLNDAVAAAANVTEESRIIMDAFLPILQMIALTLPIVALTSLAATAFATKIGLDNSGENRNYKINWLQTTTGAFASLAYLVVGLIPVFAFAIALPQLLGIAILLLIPYLIWVGVGIVLLYPVIIAEQLGGFRAVKRSFNLAKNNRRTIFFAVVIVGILASIPGAAINQFLLLVPSSVLNFVEVSTLANFASMLISVPITASGIVILYKYFHAKFHN